MRAFLALDVPDPAAEAIARLQRSAPFGRPVPEENLHLTLVFIEDLPTDLEEPVHDALSSLRSPPVRVEFSGLAGFGPVERGLLAATVAPDPGLIDLQSRAEARLRSAGLELPRRRFRPHVTLLRMSRAASPEQKVKMQTFLSAFGTAAIPGFDAAEMVLYESTLGPGGARHDELERYPLIS
ncbi:RNA 2',3'-cyclic phosphodiesterase [Rhodobacterales bacterium HKCCE3408]|nr:RNA 2',3'-cyclic phosphodiesterase [Rhodobacterales bacterium HKCCE3408]